MWTGQLFDEQFIDICIDLVESSETETPCFPGISSWPKIQGLLHGLRSELVDVPLFFSLPAIAQAAKCSPPRLRCMQYFLRQLGYRVGGSHRTTNVVKTDAPPAVLFDLFRLFILQSGIVPKTPLVPELVNRPISTVFPEEFDFLKDFAPTEKSVPIHLPNPTAFWGPKPMAAKRPRDHDDDH